MPIRHELEYDIEDGREEELEDDREEELEDDREDDRDDDREDELDDDRDDELDDEREDELDDARLDELDEVDELTVDLLPEDCAFAKNGVGVCQWCLGRSNETCFVDDDGDTWGLIPFVVADS